ncbi:TPA: DUF1801 domain-containing protein [Streptococcus suis]|uniref:DUF1801 domain-containing protein n=1 Tax=Streptococcus suis TaxID=1307 RepID=A0A9X4RSY7_STRSU|nr:DUF1801 domain-containing protein [Streptococcus parasuis]MDG4513099.1 DUF1801 domain-containing protein [Streptococcus suis]
MLIEVDTFEDYLAALPENRKEAVERLHQVIVEQLPAGFEVGILGAMINYYVPLSAYPAGYHCTPGEPLPFLALASQKNHIALYHMGLYMDEELATWFVKEYQEQVPTKLDMGKSCVRMKNPKNIPYELIGDLVSKMSMERYIELYEENHRK